jgi:DNA-binding NarL/FixJ family response regulator
MIRILIADDNALMLRVLGDSLDRHPGWKVCGRASNGLEAVSLAAELNPDLVILDLTMPELNGFQAARTIHTAAPSLPLLLFTQHLSEPLVEEEARNSGFRACVPKGSYPLLVAGIECLLQGGNFFSSAHVSALPINEDRPPEAIE